MNSNRICPVCPSVVLGAVVGWVLGAGPAGLTGRAEPWPSWRGPNQDNTAREAGYPLEWSGAASKNVKWRVALPEGGNSSPIVWGSRVFVTQAIQDGRERALICLDRETGKRLWQRSVAYEASDTRHETNPHCSASPTTDGERVVASFASAGVVSYRMDGTEEWRADLGKQKHTWGQGSSPVIHGDRVLVYHGPGEFSALYALDKKSGAVLWKVALPEAHPPQRYDGFAGKSDGMLGSFSTPLVIQAGGREEVILPVSNQVRAFAPSTGKALWTCDGMNPLVYTSPTYGEGTVVAMGGYFGATIFVKPGGEGDVTGTRRTYYEQRAKKHRIGSPIIHGGHIYVSNTLGIAECIELATGRTVWEERLKATGAKGETWGSMVRVGDRLYVVNQSGDTVVLAASPKHQVLATNPLGELSNSTPAFSEGRIFIRTHEAVWCLGEGGAKAAAN